MKKYAEEINISHTLNPSRKSLPTYKKRLKRKTLQKALIQLSNILAWKLLRFRTPKKSQKYSRQWKSVQKSLETFSLTSFHCSTHHSSSVVQPSVMESTPNFSLQKKTKSWSVKAITQFTFCRAMKSQSTFSSFKSKKVSQCTKSIPSST